MKHPGKLHGLFGKTKMNPETLSLTCVKEINLSFIYHSKLHYAGTMPNINIIYRPLTMFFWGIE